MPDGDALALTEVALHVEAAERQRVADEEEADEAEAEDGEVRAHDVRRVLGPTEAGLDQREPGLHEDDQDRPEHHPQDVHVGGNGGRRISSLGERDGAAEERHEQRSCGTSQRVLQHTFPTHQLSLVRGHGPGRPARGDPCAS